MYLLWKLVKVKYKGVTEVGIEHLEKALQESLMNSWVETQAY